MLPEIGVFERGQGCGNMVNKAHSVSWRGLTILYKGEADNRIREHLKKKKKDSEIIT